MKMVGTAGPCWKQCGPGIRVDPRAPLGTGLRRYDGVVWIPDQVQNDGGMAVWGYFRINDRGCSDGEDGRYWQAGVDSSASLRMTGAALKDDRGGAHQ